MPWLWWFQTRTAWKDILSDEDILTELDLSDDHQSGQVRLLIHQTGGEPELRVYDGPDTGVTVDFQQSFIQLSPVGLSSLVASDRGP